MLLAWTCQTSKEERKNIEHAIDSASKEGTHRPSHYPRRTDYCVYSSLCQAYIYRRRAAYHCWPHYSHPAVNRDRHHNGCCGRHRLDLRKRKKNDNGGRWKMRRLDEIEDKGLSSRVRVEENGGARTRRSENVMAVVRHRLKLIVKTTVLNI